VNLDSPALRALYLPVHERALRKQLAALDRHCRRFVELAPFVSRKHPPSVAIEVRLEEAYLPCAKAFMRSRLWRDAATCSRARCA
jgi:predicted pyridoxine 5'-phosphate oxidase superfamily flavin-nucleotide-binding protein